MTVIGNLCPAFNGFSDVEYSLIRNFDKNIARFRCFTAKVESATVLCGDGIFTCRNRLKYFDCRRNYAVIIHLSCVELLTVSLVHFADGNQLIAALTNLGIRISLISAVKS